MGARADYFPWSLSPGLIPLQFTSLSLEAGALFFDSTSSARPMYLTLGIRVWI